MEGENEKIGDKLTNKENWLKLASKNGSGCYLLPYCDSIGGLVFDYGDFVEKGWLNFADGNDSSVTAALDVQGIVYENNGGKLVYKSGGSVNYSSGDRILSAGKDGKYGTYDDGQPQTIAEWDQMLGKIKSTANCYPFIWPNKFENYTGMVQNAVFAQLAGVESAENYLRYDYCTLTDEEMDRNHIEDENRFMEEPECTATEYDYYRYYAYFADEATDAETAFRRALNNAMANGEEYARIKCADRQCFDETLDWMFGDGTGNEILLDMISEGAEKNPDMDYLTTGYSVINNAVTYNVSIRLRKADD